MPQEKINNPVLFQYLKNFNLWWSGFNEQDHSRLPTAAEKRQMLRYPIISGIIQLIVLPLLSPKISIEGNEKQKTYVEYWFKRYYRRIMALMAEKAVGWGYSVGERIIAGEQVDGSMLWVNRSAIIPSPNDCHLKYSTENAGITGFEFNNYEVMRYAENGSDDNIPGMIYYAFRGEEISRPQGWPVVNDLFWAWQLVMKEWTSWVVYKRLKMPVWAMDYIPELVKDGTSQTDNARTAALQNLDDLKNAAGMALPKVKDKDGNWVKGWELEGVDIQDREPGFHESIKMINSLMYIAALMPERLMEQFKDTGSQGMVSVQKDFYTSNILAPRIAELKEFVSEWFVYPMLRMNFGKVDIELEMTALDAMAELYVEIVRTAVQGGSITGIIDWKQLAEKIGLPVSDNDIEPVIEQPIPKVQGKGFTPKEKEEEQKFEMTRREQKAKVAAHAEKWVRDMDRNIRALKEKVYTGLEKELRSEQGRIGLAVAKLYDNPNPKPEDIAKTVQIPRRVFNNIWPFSLQAWEIGMNPWIEEAKKKFPTPYMTAPSKPIEKELWSLTIEIEGFERGNVQVAGEGELLERRLFTALRYGADSKESALQIVNENFNKYIEEILPNRLINIFHAATVLGSKDALAYLQQRDLERKRG
jgi:hypothetical protein